MPGALESGARCLGFVSGVDKGAESVTTPGVTHTQEELIHTTWFYLVETQDKDFHKQIKAMFTNQTLKSMYWETIYMVNLYFYGIQINLLKDWRP